MKRLPPAKRNQLLGVIAFTAALLCGVYFLLIQPQNQKNVSLGLDIDKATQHLHDYKKIINQMNDAADRLAELNRQLNRAEEDVASGDLYAWTVDTIRRFKSAYHVEIPTMGQPSQSDCDLIANFPYKQIRFSLNGTAHYHDLGRFVADFENQFPHCRVLNLTADPIGQSSGGNEKLTFQMEIVALVKPVN